jgi:sugar lactone lactonase YvrE
VVSVNVGQPGDPSSSSPKTDGTIQVVASGFKIPIAVKFDLQDRLHVADSGTGQVFLVNTSTGMKTLVATIEPGLDNLAFDSGDNLFVSNFENGTINRILPDGQGQTVSQGGMVFPGGVAVLGHPDGKESVFVANAYTLNELIGLTGNQVNIFSGNQGLLTTPFTVSADGDHLILSSWYGRAVKVWDPKTKKVLKSYPMPVPLNAIRFQDDIVVADLGLGGVVRVSDHAMILQIDNTSVLLPAGLATDGETLWVADRATDTIWQIDFEGKTPSAPVPVAVGLANPEGLALDIDGNLLVVEAGKQRLTRVDLTTGEVSIIADGLELGLEGTPGLPPTWAFNGVAVGSSGAIYITGDVTNVLYRIWPR